MAKLKELLTTRKRNLSKIALSWVGATLLLILLVIIMFRFEPPPPKKVVIATGSRSGAYHAFAKQYASHFSKNGIEMEVLETAGSLENMQLLASGKADIAIVQGGVKDSIKEVDDFRSLGSIYYEPLWVFYRGKTINLLSELKGKRINIGPDGSGVQAVAGKLLDVNGITKNNATIMKMKGTEAATALQDNKLDVAFFIASPQADIIQQLVHMNGVKLMNFRRHRAYARNFGFIKETTIIEGLLDLKQNTPKHDTVLLATTAAFTVKKDLHPVIVELLLQSARIIHGKQGTIHNHGEFPTIKYTEFPMLESAQQNLENGPSLLSRYLPFWMVLIVRRSMLMIIPLLTLLIPLGKGLPLIFHWTAKRKIDQCYVRLLVIEELVHKHDSPDFLQEAIDDVRKLYAHAETIKAPTGYRKDVYQLRWHGAHLLEKLEKRKAEQPKPDQSKPL